MALLLLCVATVLVEQFTRQHDGTWNLHELRAGHRLRCPCGEIAVDDLYVQVGPLQGNAR